MKKITGSDMVLSEETWKDIEYQLTVRYPSIANIFWHPGNGYECTELTHSDYDETIEARNNSESNFWEYNHFLLLILLEVFTHE